MAEFEEKLEQILNNPQAMDQIFSLAQSLGGGEPSAQGSTEKSAVQPDSGAALTLDPGMLGTIAALMGELNQGDDQRTALLQALRPFLREERCAHLDRAIQITKLSRMARAALELLKSKESGHV